MEDKLKNIHDCSPKDPRKISYINPRLQQGRSFKFIFLKSTTIAQIIGFAVFSIYSSKNHEELYKIALEENR